MLVSFKVENFKSFKNKEEFSMETGEGLPVDTNISLPSSKVPVHGVPDFAEDYLLKNTVILGSSFQGKSNLINSLQTFRRLVLNDQFYILQSYLYAYDPTRPITWELVLTDNKLKVVKYTLVYAPEDSDYYSPQKLVIERNNKAETYDLINLPKKDLGKLDINKDYIMLQNWLNNRVTFLSTDCTSDMISVLSDFDIDDTAVIDQLLYVLAYFGISKDDITRCFNYTHGFEDSLQTIFYNDDLSDLLEPSGCAVAYLTRLIVMLYVFQNKKDSIILIDDFDSVLSTEYAESLIRLFNSKINKCQVVVTTRNPEVLDFGLREDQLWFVNKDMHDVSTLYSLFDFDEDNDTYINYVRGYREGRYGGVNVSAPELLKYEFENLVKNE